jgi:hypothetical protein
MASLNDLLFGHRSRLQAGLDGRPRAAYGACGANTVVDHCLRNKMEGRCMRIPNSLLAMGILLLLAACNRWQSDEPKTVAAASSGANNLPGIGLGSHALGKRYRVTITYAELDNTPRWSEDEENPPLSAKKALQVANKMKDSLVKDDEKHKWTLESLTLTPAGKSRWYWVVTYEPRALGVVG